MALTTPSVTVTADEELSILREIAPEFMKGAQDQTLRDHLLLALWGKYGKILFSEGGAGTCTWLVKYRKPRAQAHGAWSSFTFNHLNDSIPLTIDWRGYIMTDEMDEKHYAILSNAYGELTNYYDEAFPRMEEAYREQLQEELYIDGNLDANANRVCGFETALGDDGTTIATDLIANPSDTYGGQSTALGAIDGATWSTDLAAANRPNATVATDWPHGRGRSEYDALSPLLLNATSTRWPSKSPVWDDNCMYLIRQGNNWMKKNGGKKNAIKCISFPSDLYTPMQNYLEARTRETVPHQEAEDMGFAGVINFEGIMLHQDFGCPAGAAYGWAMDAVELANLYPDLYKTEGPEKDMKSDTILFKLRAFCNTRFRPKGLMKIKAYA